MDYSEYEKTSAIPEAGSMIETFRAIGYNIEAAVADIIDNSISAGAKNISVDFEWLGTDTWISIKDDGIGMSDAELIQAMRPGSKNPLADRGSKDLGRFGLGLKTASFSQCRKLTVISKKKNGEPAFWTWDLDFVNSTGEWQLIKYEPNDIFFQGINSVKSGTIVIWNDIDRLVKDFKKDDNSSLDKFLGIMQQVKSHLAMVFHRFLENGKIKISFQDRPLKGWNPFLPFESATQGFPEEPFYNGSVIVKGYVLPHKSKMTNDKFRESEGPKGWNEQQGFYIYRNDRLLLAGDWLGMYRKEEHYKLARIEINLPNSLDTEWQIDIKKSIARPPHALRDNLRAYAGKVRLQAVEVYRHKGKNVKPYPGQKFVPLWIDHKRGDKWFYKINRNHPIIENIRNQAKVKPDLAIDMLMKLIEESIPVKSIYIKEAEEPESQGKPFEGLVHNDIRSLMQTMFDSLIMQGKSIEESKAVIFNIEPFNHFPEYIETLSTHD
jgi:hypothetical protein